MSRDPFKPHDSPPSQAEGGNEDVRAEDVDEETLDLQDVLSLMAQEVERLKVSLEYFRNTDHPDKEERIRWHVHEIDRRQDRLEELKRLILDTSKGSQH